MSGHRQRPSSGFTLLELLVVIGLLAVVAIIAVPVVNSTKERAAVSTQIANLRSLTLATLQWAADHGQALPSPEYPGGYSGGARAIPEHWDYTKTGTGLWLDGVIYHAIYQDQPLNFQTREAGSVGDHLKDTVFFSEQSYKKNPSDQNWYHHSYAMNRSLQHNPILTTSGNPELTNKRLARLSFRASALLFTENENSNVIGFEDRNQIIATAEKRWKSGKAVSSFLDGSVQLLGAADIPAESRRVNRESCKFWSGVDPSAFKCGTCLSKGGRGGDHSSGGSTGGGSLAGGSPGIWVPGVGGSGTDSPGKGDEEEEPVVTKPPC